MASAKSLKRLRSAGGVEKWPMARHALGIYKNVAVSAVYTCSQSITHDHLQTTIFEALALVIMQHPILSAIPVEEDTQKQYWARLNQIDLRRCVTFTTRSQSWDPATDTDEELDGLLEREHNTDFKGHYGELPFWRLAVLHEEETAARFVASFVFHRGIADTMSGLAFHRSFLNALLRTQSDKRDGDQVEALTSYLVQPPDTPLLSPLEKLHSLPLSWPFIFKQVKAALFSSSKPELWTGDPVPSTYSDQRSRFRSFTFSSDTTRQILAASREHIVTITSLLQVLIINALFTAIPRIYTALSVEGAISFRRFIKSDTITQGSMGCYVSGYTDTHRRNAVTDLPWDEARRVRKAIEDELSKRGKNTVAAMSRFIFSYKYYFNSMRGQSRESSLELSNVGRFVPGNQHEKSINARWSIGKMVFSQSVDVTGAAILCSIVTGEDGRLSLGFTCLGGGVNEEIVERLIEGVKENVQGISCT